MSQVVRLSPGIDAKKLDDFRKRLSTRPQDFTLGLEALARWDRYGGRCTCLIGRWYMGGKEMDARAHRLELGAPSTVEETIGVMVPEDRLEPVEAMLSALGSSIASAIVFNAFQAGIGFDGLELSARTTVDPGILFGTRPLEEISQALGAIEVEVRVIGDVSPNDLERLKEMARRSPVYGFLTQPTSINLQMRQVQPEMRLPVRTVVLEGSTSHREHPFGPESTEYAPESGATAERLMAARPR